MKWSTHEKKYYRVSQKKVSDKIFLGYYLLVLTTGQLTSMPARRRGLEPRSHDRPQLVHLCLCLSSWHCLWNSQSWSPRLLARQIWGDHPSRRPALHCQACQACSSQFKHRWRRCKRDSTLAIMSINADCWAKLVLGMVIKTDGLFIGPRSDYILPMSVPLVKLRTLLKLELSNPCWLGYSIKGRCICWKIYRIWMRCKIYKICKLCRKCKACKIFKIGKN